VAIALTCRCGKQLSVRDELAGKRVRCPACAETLDVPPVVTFASGKPPPSSKPALTTPPPVPSRAATSAAEPDIRATTSLLRRYLWVWLGLAAVVPVLIGCAGVSLYLWLNRDSEPTIVDKPEEKQAVQPAAPGAAGGAPQAAAPPGNIPADTFAFIDRAVKESRVQVAEKGFLVGRPGEHSDIPAGGGILVGFNAGTTNGPFGPQVSALQPIYLTRQGETVGQWFGTAPAPPAQPIVMRAKPGYVVGSLHLRTGAIFDAFSMTFVRFDRDRTISEDTYASEWIGGRGGNLASVGGPGQLIVGVCGHIGAGGNVCAIGAVTLRAKQ
jgi:hypothetical protein